MLAHHIQLLQEENPQWSVLKTDIKMPSILHQDNKCLMKCMRVFQKSLRMLLKCMVTAVLWSMIEDRLDTIIIPLQQGVHQGDLTVLAYI